MIRSSVNSNRWGRAAVVVAAMMAMLTAIGVAGCGDASVDAELLKQAGEHGVALERVYSLYGQDVLNKASARDLKDINAALKAGDLKRATRGDLRRAQDEIRSRIDKLSRFNDDIRAAGRKLKNTRLPDFKTKLSSADGRDAFARAYARTAATVSRYTTSDLAAVKIAFSSLEKYLDFLEQWEEFLEDNDTAGLVAAGEASDKALARLNKIGARLKRRGSLNSKIGPLVDQMASAASDSSELTALVNELKKQYPKSFLAIHIVEKQ